MSDTQPPQSTVSMSVPLESVTFKVVAMNFTLDEWNLLNPQKQLYNNVIWEVFRNLVLMDIMVDPNIEDVCINLWRNLSIQKLAAHLSSYAGGITEVMFVHPLGGHTARCMYAHASK